LSNPERNHVIARAIIWDLTCGVESPYGRLALVSVFVVFIFYLQPALAFAVVSTTEPCSPLNVICVSINDDAYTESGVVATPATSDKGNEIDLIGGNRKTIRSARDRDRLSSRVVGTKFEARRNHTFACPKDARGYGSHEGICVPRIDVSEVNVPERTLSSQINFHAEDYDFGPMCRDEFLSREVSRLFRGGNGSLQLDALPAKHEKLEKGDDGKGTGSPKKQFSETSEPPIILCLFILVFCVGGALLLTLFGWQNFYNNRRLLGASLIGLGGLFGLGGLGWWWSWVL
jgi:hypothetical protein